MRFILAAATVVLLTPAAHAGCSCECVNGQVQAICDSAIDLRPICAPRVCGIAPPSVAPVQPPMLPPLGTSSCAPQMVQNPQTMMYEWRTICR